MTDDTKDNEVPIMQRLQKQGRFRTDPDDEQIKSMIASVRAGYCDWSQWKDWLVMGQHDEGVLQDIVVAKVVRIERA